MERGPDHPLRQRILATMVAGEDVDSAQISQRLGQSLSQVSYHLRVLAQSGAIAVVDDRTGRGPETSRYTLGSDARAGHIST